MSVKYVKCDCCGRKIPMGRDVWVYSGYCGVYCSAECFAEGWGDCLTLDEEIIEDNGCKVYDDDQRKKDLLKEIQELTEKLTKANFELESLQ